MMNISDVGKAHGLVLLLDEVDAFLRDTADLEQDRPGTFKVHEKGQLLLTVKDLREYATLKRNEVLTKLKNWGIVPDTTAPAVPVPVGPEPSEETV